MPIHRRARRDREGSSWVSLAVVLVPVLSILLAIDFALGTLGCGGVPFLVRGRVVDASTGTPVEGVSVLTLFEKEMADDAEELEGWRDTAREFEGATEEDGRLMFTIAGSAHTGPDGGFTIVAQLSTSVTTGASGIVWRRERSSPHEIAGALLVEREGYERLVHETTGARWVERREGQIVGTFEVGTIRLAPR